ncbi:hypothetical protein GQ602_005852 [Ophiocordyceps camponoti-floridani]|uniref:Uncharacterized protein n=1 Tax=Ophiocordyceps camponoti-floridani TaxID=2030778 RepID=A0A8H4Q456_9HYPO|nr:hypothetical protein GQ602_005852 [Ophiocordyceps camponoti-floridani]
MKATIMETPRQSSYVSNLSNSDNKMSSSVPWQLLTYRESDALQAKAFLDALDKACRQDVHPRVSVLAGAMMASPDKSEAHLPASWRSYCQRNPRLAEDMRRCVACYRNRGEMLKPELDGIDVPQVRGGPVVWAVYERYKEGRSPALWKRWFAREEDLEAFCAERPDILAREYA